MNEIKNFSKCELNTEYQVNGKALVIERVSTHKNGHYLYTGTIDGMAFTEQNSPQLKKLLGIETIKYDREGGNSGGSAPRIGKEITEDGIKSSVDALYAKCNKAVDNLASIFSEETMIAIKNLVNEEINDKADALREELTQKMAEQQAAKLAREQKRADNEAAEALKERCRQIGTTYQSIKKMADAMGVTAEEMITNMEGMRK